MMEGFRHGYREPGHLNGELTVPGRSVVGHHLLDLNRIYGLT